MLKSTHKAVAPPALPEGWTEHKAPTGHSYYFNTATKQSTYNRPAPPAPINTNPPLNPAQSFLQFQGVDGSFSGPGPNSNKFPAHGQQDLGSRVGFHSQRGGRGGQDRARNPRPQPTDKPQTRHSIPGCEPWVLVSTKLGRRFVYNTQRNESFWRIPDKLKDGILALDQLRIKEKADAMKEKENPVVGAEAAPAMGEAINQQDEAGSSSEYEEVEVTDEEEDMEDGAEGEEHPSKRQRISENAPEEPLDFNEDDIAYQLAAMGQEYGLEPGDYDDGNMKEWEEGVAGIAISHEDSTALFEDLLNDFNVNPYSPWDKLVDEGKLVNDIRYTALHSMRSRKEVWERWSREKIRVLREHRAKEEKKDPMIPYIAFLEKHASAKLYWPEFKRKYKKTDEMRSTAITDKEREKLYRDYINRLKHPQSTLKSDLSSLLKSQPLYLLNNATNLSHLPPTILTNIIYISLPASSRDPLIEAYISTLGPPPDSIDEDESEEAKRARKEKDRRQKALEERERIVADEKRHQRRSLAFGKGRLMEEEAEIARAMNVGKKGLMGHLVEDENS